MEELEVCPVCHEDCAYIETEGGWSVYAVCGNCGTHTAFCDMEKEGGQDAAALKVTRLWNMGKVIRAGNGE